MRAAWKRVVEPDSVTLCRWHDLKWYSQGFPLTFRPHTPKRKIDCFDRWYFAEDFVSRRAEEWQSCEVSAIRSAVKLSVLPCRIKTRHGHLNWASKLRRALTDRLEQGPMHAALRQSAYLLFVFQIKLPAVLKGQCYPCGLSVPLNFLQTRSRKIHWGTFINVTSYIARTRGRFSALSPYELCRQWATDDIRLRELYLVSDSRS